ncbi:Csu type fimbrial protein [Saccharospirillum salsuginis]|uniref:Spore coat protein U/FanG domain-containing protein n=1 Tax=Saccharospirillum salsuginis TaxID=418750 RepID=A0A918JZA3_9GAMM|nr:spore coat U domain-containing protein [Saccharospirillum salsuginis]GGX39606.1 hypothetical protein GCM10007392_02570 [Saccharospirillum salsuginis]
MSFSVRILLSLFAGLGAPLSLACTLSATPIAFGSVNPLDEAPTDTVGTLTVTCPEPVSYTLSATSGQGGYTQRQMTFGDHELAYNLYIDSEFLFVFGDGTGDTRVISGEGTNSEHVVHGWMPSQPTAIPGVYSDDIVVTLSY